MPLNFTSNKTKKTSGKDARGVIYKSCRLTDTMTETGEGGDMEITKAYRYYTISLQEADQEAQETAQEVEVMPDNSTQTMTRTRAAGRRNKLSFARE